MNKNIIERIDLNIKEILTNWSVSDAIRELIANAFDESTLSNTTEPYINFNEGTLIIRDYGNGIEADHFIQNENKLKKEKDVIGKFGIGLKDSISVLYRNNKKIVFKSKNGIFYPSIHEKSGLNSKIETIHMCYERKDLDFCGTEITIYDIDEKDYSNAKNNFIKLLCIEPIYSCSKGEIYENEIISSIYCKGMKISEDNNFIFSYNILQPNSKFSKSLNRERKMISRDAYRENVISILNEAINSKNKNVMDKILYSSETSNSSEWSFLDVKKAILKNDDTLLVGNKSVNQNDFKSYADKQNYRVVWVNDKDYKSIYNDERLSSRTLDFFGSKFINEYEKKYIEPDDLNSFQYENYEWIMKKIKALSEVWIELKWIYKDIKIFIIEKHPNASGIADHKTKKITLVKSIFSSKKNLLNTVIHEICHLVSKESDVTLGFEKALTSAFYYLYLLGKQN